MNYTVSTIEKIDERFNINEVDNYIKSIRLAPDGFSYIVTDPHTRYQVALRDYQFGTEISVEKGEEILSDLFENEDILSSKHSQLNISYINRPWAMVPEMLFVENELPKLINVNFKNDDFAYTTHSRIPGTELFFASRIPETWFQLLRNQANNVNFIPHQAAFAYNALNTLKYNSLPNAFFMLVHSGFFDLLYIENYKVKFYNNFKYNQYADVLYFTLSTFEKMEANSSEGHIFLQGNDLVKEILPSELKKHIRYVYMDKELYGERYSPEFDQLPLYQYKLLTGINACG